jgi:hypothetical protein
MMSNEKKTQNDKPGARPWVKPEVKEAGNVADVLQGGGGKLSLVSQDPGDTRKPSGQG